MHHPLPKYNFSLRLKITLLFLMLVIVMMATIGYIFTVRELDLSKEQMKVSMERLANNIAAIRSVETEDWDVYQTYIDNQIKVNPDIIYVAIFDDQNRLRVHALNRDWLELESSRPLTRMEQGGIIMQLDQRQIASESQRDFERQSVQIMVGARNLGRVNIGFSLVDLNDEMKRNLRRNLLIDSVFLLLAVLLAFFIGSRIINPLGKLTAAMAGIAQGKHGQQLQITSRDEIGKMASTFNYMSRGLQEKQIIENYSRELGVTIELEKIARFITGRIGAALRARAGLLYLGGREAAGRFELVSAWPEGPAAGARLEIGEESIALLLEGCSARPLTTLPDHAALRSVLRAGCEATGEALVAPVVIKDALRGIFILCGPQEPPDYSEDEIRLLDTLLSQGGIAIENALLYEELAGQERLKQEFEIARRVQQSLLPQETPRMTGLDIDGICIPAEEIGGDYFDFFTLDGHTLGITIADVTGKGTSAAFYMAVIKGMMLSLTSIYRSPKELLSELNRRLLGTMEKKIFVTMTYAVINVEQRLMVFARAGHSALIRRTGDARVESLTPRGISLGLAGGGHFEEHIIEQRVRYEPGDLFLFYTDGISEAMNRGRQEFGEERLLAWAARAAGPSAGAIRQELLEQVGEFTRSAPRHDDITLVTVRALQ